MSAEELEVELIGEAAFQIYWRFCREPNEARARSRFARLKPERRDEWEADAKAAFRVFQKMEKVHEPEDLEYE